MQLSRLFLYVSLFLFLSPLYGQTLSSESKPYEISGQVVDMETGEPIMYANIVLYDMRDTLIVGTNSDFDGFYQIKVASGWYKLEASYVGYQKAKVDSVYVGKEAVRLNLTLEEGNELQYIIITTDRPKPVPETTSRSVQRLSTEEISRMSTRNVQSLQGATAGVNQTDEGRALSSNGSRSSGNDVYVDGVRVIGGADFPQTDLDPIESGTESYAAIEESKYQDVWKQPLSTFSIDVDNASYTNIRRMITAGASIPADAVRIEEMLNYFSYDYAAPTDDVPFAVHTELSECPWAENHQLLRIGLKGAALPEALLEQASNYVFLLDVSGSMVDLNKLPLLKKAFRKMIDELQPNDRVAIVVYAGASGLVLPSTKVRDKERIIEALNALSSGGSTAGGAGIELAYKVAKENFIPNGNNRVILATDGDFNIGVSNSGELQRLIEKKRDSGIFLTVTGFGMGNYKDDNLETLANHGNGNYAYIDSEEEAEKFFVRDLRSNFYTIAKDVKFQLEFNPNRVAAYRLIGYENRLLDAEDFNDDKKDAGELGPGHNVTALYEIIPKKQASTYASNIDPLRYQTAAELLPAAQTEELLFCKLRYKTPDGDTSQLTTQALSPVVEKLKKSSVDQQFAASVAAFGLILRGSAYKGKAKSEMVLKWARKGKGKDKEGYRKDFIELVEKYQEQQSLATAEEE